MLNKEIRSALLYYTRPCLYYNGVATAEGTGFWTPEAKGPSSGVVASIVLIIIALSSVIVLFFYTTHRLYWVYYKKVVLRKDFSKIMFQKS